MKFDIETQGFKELNKALERLPDRAQGRVLQNAVTSGGMEARKEIKSAALKGDDRSAKSLE